ncbi:hypothetical protein K501DRAFT_272058 [Backusella circina FSU 941]|nr:hypothetical protein K501DRAFT_272058 [Backusella circina FSU 941]
MNPIQSLYEQNNFDNNNAHFYTPPPPQPPAEANSSKRMKKDRACDLCRRKKVKCNFDFMNPENQCTSCVNYHKLCTFNEAAKKRGPPKGYVEKLETRLKRIESTLTNIAQAGNLPPELLTEILDNPTEQSTSCNKKKDKKKTGKQKEKDETDIQHVVPEDPNRSLSYLGSSSGFYMLNRLFSQSSHPAFRDANIFSQSLDGDKDDMLTIRPQFENFIPPKKVPDWKPPPKELVDHLVTLQVFYTFKYPITNYRPRCFLCKLSSRYKPGPSTTYCVNLSCDLSIHKTTDILQPNIQTIQIILLFTSNGEKWELESQHWVLTSIAVKMAQDLGLHRSNTNNNCISKKDMESKKRLWWSIVCVDRWVSASLGRPLTISDADCDVGYPDSEGTKYSFFLQMIKLSCILGEVLRSICSPRSRVLSEKGVDLEQVSSNLELLLQEWKYSLPADLKFTDEELSRISRGGRLFLCYYTIFLIIKRPILAISSSASVTLPPECQNAIDVLVHLLDAIDITHLLCGWSLSNFQNDHLESTFKRFHLKLAEFIKNRSIVPFLDALSKALDQVDDSSEADGEDVVSRTTNAITSNQPYLWNMSNNIEWEEMVKLLAETGYQS